AAQHFTHGADALEVVWVVQWCEVDRVLDAREDGIIDYDRFREVFATMHHAMSDGVDAAKARTGDFVSEPTQGCLDGRTVVTDRSGRSDRGPVGRVDPDQRFAANPVDEAAGKSHITVRRHAFGIGRNDLELEGRRTRVQDEYVHCPPVVANVNWFCWSTQV